MKRSSVALSFETDFWRKNWLPGLILFTLAFALYFISINFEYILDDSIVFTENAFVKKGISGISEIMGTESFTGYFGEQKDLVVGSRYRPLSLITFAIEHQFFGLNSKISHFINILLYGLTGLLFFRIVSILLPARKSNYWWMALPFVAAMIFVAHPVHSEVVANVKGRDEILSLMCAIATLYFSLKYIASKQKLWIILSAVMFFLALLAKENALTFLAVVPLTIYCFSRANWKENLTATLPLLVVSLLYLGLRYTVIGYLLSSGTEVIDIMNNPFYGLKTGEKFATIFYTLGLYIKLLFYPYPLTHDYYPFHIPVMQWSDWQTILAFLTNAALLAYALFGIWRKHVLAYSILVYFITLSIVSNIPFTVGTFMNERFIYTSSIGFCIAIAWLLSRKIPDWVQAKEERYNFLSIGLFAIIMVGFSGITINRVPAWRNSMSLNRAAIEVSKNSARANCFMGTALFNEYKVETDPQVKAALLEDIDYYINRSLEINPKFASALTMKSGIVAEIYKRDNDLDKLLDEFYKLITFKPNLSFIDEFIEYLIGRADNQKLGDWCYKVGVFFLNRYNQPQYALKYLQQYGMQVAPNDKNLNRAIGEAYQKLGNTTEAQKYFDKAH